MVSFTVRMRFRPDDREKVEAILRELTLASRTEPGCVTYVAHQVAADPNTVLIYEQYRDDAAVEAHRTTPHFQRWAENGLYTLMLGREVEALEALL